MLLDSRAPKADIRLGLYDAECLEKSWAWLQDPEVKRLTMTPEFTRAQQNAFFASLPHRNDYLIWSVLLGTEIIGAAGLKNHRGTRAEYWGYIGEKQLWGKGLGSSLVQAVEKRAVDAGFCSLDLRVAHDNLRAIRLYEKFGFSREPRSSTTEYMWMVKGEIR
jgi:RimJ/RimL family protein N-acetyltransferase